jgi:hypothetical protein
MNIANIETAGFSANMFEQLADVIEETSLGGITFAFSLSPEWTPPPDLRTAREISVGAQDVEFARSAAKIMRGQPRHRPEQVLGRVIRLQKQADPTELFSDTSEGEVIVQWSSEELGDVQVRMRLNPNDYLVAVEAHGSGRPVTVSGSLKQEGRRWLLTSPANFSVA